MTTGSGFDLDRLGEVFTGPPVGIDRDLGATFAAAINDPDPGHRAGDTVTPMAVVLPIYAVLYQAVNSVTPAEFQQRGVHGAHDVAFLRTVRPGSALHARARAVGVHPGRTGSAVTVEISVLDDAEALVSEQFATAYIRGLLSPISAGRTAPDTALGNLSGNGSGNGSGNADPAASATVTIRSPIDADQADRYAAASGDHQSIHEDAEIARSAGFRGVILHGLCTMAIAGVAATRASGQVGRADPLRRLAVRLAAPVYPGGELQSRFSFAGSHQPRTEAFRLDFDSIAEDGQKVISAGVAEFGSLPVQ